MHDWLYEQEPPLADADVLEFARTLGLDMERFARDLESDETRARASRTISPKAGATA